jgi:arsenate reductase (thioredoxin)
MQCIRSLIVLCALTLMCSSGAAQTRETSAPQPSRLVFVCEHGSAKSLIAATFFNRIAAERGLPVRAIARGLTPVRKVPERVVHALRAEGFDVASFEPARASDEELSVATRVVGMEIERSALGPKTVSVEIWEDMPLTADYRAFRGDLLDRIEELLLSLHQADASKVSADAQE